MLIICISVFLLGLFCRFMMLHHCFWYCSMSESFLEKESWNLLLGTVDYKVIGLRFIICLHYWWWILVIFGCILVIYYCLSCYCLGLWFYWFVLELHISHIQGVNVLKKKMIIHSQFTCGIISTPYFYIYWAYRTFSAYLTILDWAINSPLYLFWWESYLTTF